MMGNQFRRVSTFCSIPHFFILDPHLPSSMSVASALVNLRSRTRIIAIPLSRPRIPVTTKSGPPIGLTYYQFQLASRETKRRLQEAEEEADKSRLSWIPKGGLVKWAQNKAADTWASFGKAEGGWKLKTFQFGERMVDRMEFEELALKSVDPSLGPSLTHPASSEMESSEKVGLRIPLYYPPKILSRETVMSELRQYVEHRIPAHRKGFYTWLAIAPLTAPFMIVPVIPNLPFFFCIWRSWSHYRDPRNTYNPLLDQEVIVPEPSEELDQIYEEYTPKSLPPPSDHSPAATPQHQLLLTKAAVPAILDRFQLEPSVSADLYRALEQVRVRNGGKAEP
ncbi:hypothetical protein NMY22_g18088 [Coprinellus aureogranulatus]|nr:hypothetical protein NMY22_g18088 [Coprinellus aureogranulatus]